MYPHTNIFTQDVGYLTMKEEDFIKDVKYLNVNMVFPSIKIDYEYSVWCPVTTLE